MNTYDNIPAELKPLKQWVCWKAIENKKNPGKLDKRPINPLTGKYAKSNDPDTWTDFKTAVHASQRFDGIGFMFANGYFGVDIDHVEKDIDSYILGYTDNIVHEFIETLQSYAEYSVSETGIHIICKGKLPLSGSRKSNVEMYSGGRFFVMTGKKATEYTKISDCTEKIKALYGRYIVGESKEQDSSSNYHNRIAEILNRVYDSIQCFSFFDLYEGEWQEYFKSQSEADLSFCNMLAFWCNKDKNLMDAFFRSSGLMRDKWDRRQNGTTYGDETLEKAIKSCKDTYGMKSSIITKLGDAIDMATLQQTELPTVKFIIEGLLSFGLHMLAAPPKYGKSFLVLLICIIIAIGDKLWGRNTQKSDVLYLALEDSLNRIKGRMEKILQGAAAPGGARVVTDAPNLDNGLVEGLEEHLKKYPDTRLIIIDTFQKVRGSNNSKDTAYAVDYRDMGALKAFADKHGIAVLLVHHLRKMKDDDDPFNMVSGTNGITGAADTTMVMAKDKRNDENTILHVTGRDVETQEILLKFNKETCIWELVSENAKQHTQEQEFYNDATVKFLQEFITPEKTEWSGTASELLKEMDSSGIFGDNYPADATRMTLRLNKLSPQLYKIKVKYAVLERTSSKRGIHLLYIGI